MSDTDSCPICDWDWGAGRDSRCAHCGRPPMAEYDTGMDTMPEPVTAFDDGPGEAGDRTATTTTEARLADAGILHPYTGLEVVSRGAWKQHHRAVSDTPLLEYLLADGARAHVAFYCREFGYDDVEGFLAAGDQGDLMDCPTKVAATWTWIRDLRPPTSPDAVRRCSPFWDAESTSSSRQSSPEVPDINDTEQGDLSSFQ